MGFSKLDRRIKYSGEAKKSAVNHTEKRINKKLDMNVIDLLCSYVICSNRNIRKGAFINLRNFIECLNMDMYTNEPEAFEKFNFIKRGLDARINNSLNNPAMIIQYINGSFIDENLIDVNQLTELSNESIEFVNGMVTQALQYTFIDEEIDVLSDLIVRWKSSDFRMRSVLADEFMTVINRLNNKFRKAVVEPMDQITFALREDRFEQAMCDIYNKLTDTSRMLRTGMQGINELLGGGFFASRCYMLLGCTGVGKSLTLMDLAIQIKKYNKLVPKDPTKNPCIVYLTMENDVVESVDRLFTMVTSKDIRDLTQEEAIRTLREDGELLLNSEDNIDIIIKFIPNRSIDTGYLYTLVEGLEDDGYEVNCFILDHVKRIRSCYKQPDLRIELGEVVNECKTFASMKDLIFITNSHLNRDANATIDKGAGPAKADLTKLLGKHNIGESMLMLDNLDCGFIINAEYDKEGNKYMVYKRIKMRYKATARDYLAQPYVKGNDIKLMEDYYSPVPVFKDTLDEYAPLNVGSTVSSSIRGSNYCKLQQLDTTVPTQTEEEKNSIYQQLDFSSGFATYTEDSAPVNVNVAYMDEEEIEKKSEEISKLICPLIMLNKN